MRLATRTSRRARGGTKSSSTPLNKDELIEIANIEDADQRASVIIRVMEFNQPVAEAIAQVTNPSLVAQELSAAHIERAMSDQDWLETYCPWAKKAIQDPTAFNEDAILYRHDRDARDIYRVDGQGKAAAAILKNGYRPYARQLIRFLFIPHPKEWFYCDDCNGRNVDVPDCYTCKGTGYTIPVYRRIPAKYRSN
jgi:hypothetical protein